MARRLTRDSERRKARRVVHAAVERADDERGAEIVQEGWEAGGDGDGLVDDRVGVCEGAEDGALGSLGEELVGEAEGGLGQAAGEETAETEEEFLEELVGDEVDAGEVWAVWGEEGGEFGAGALVNDEVCVDVAGAEEAEVVEGEDGFAAEAGGGVLGGDEDA